MLIAVPMKKTKGFVTHKLTLSQECNAGVRKAKATVINV